MNEQQDAQFRAVEKAGHDAARIVELEAEVAKWKAMAIYSGDEGTSHYYKDHVETLAERVRELEGAIKCANCDQAKLLEELANVKERLNAYE